MINTTNLLKQQIPHVKTLVDSLHLNGFAADLSETGCGKTFCSTAVAREIKVPTFIICPKIVIPSWESCLKFFNIRALGIKNYEMLIRGTKNSVYTHWVKEDCPSGRRDANGNPVQVDRLRFTDKLPKNALIIFDEAHKGKGVDSSTSELFMTAREQGFKTLLVSASMCTNPIEMKAFGYVTRLHSSYNHNDFKRTFARAHGAEWRKGKTGGLVFDAAHPDCQRAMSNIHSKLFDDLKCASRLTTADMAEHFGHNHVMAQAFDVGSNKDKINNVYEQMEYELDQLEERSGNYSAHIFAIMMRARRHSELLKVPTFVENIEETIRNGKSAAIFLNFNESIDACIKRLEKLYRTPKMIRLGTAIEIVTIRGGQSAKARQAAIDAFQNDTARIIVCNIAAGGVGVSLHDLNGKHARESFISPNYNAIQIHQSLGRIYRAGAASDAVQKVVFAAGTIEEVACERVQAKLHNLALLNDGDLAAGFEFFASQVDDWEVKAA